MDDEQLKILIAKDQQQQRLWHNSTAGNDETRHDEMRHDKMRHDEMIITDSELDQVCVWLLEVCEEQQWGFKHLSVATEIMDRFISVCSIRRSQLQLLAVVSLLLAFKSRNERMHCNKYSGERSTNDDDCHEENVKMRERFLVAYSDHNVTHKEIRAWELLLLSKLEWRTSDIICPEMFVENIKSVPISDPIFFRNLAFCNCQAKFRRSFPSARCRALALHSLSTLEDNGPHGINENDEILSIMSERLALNKEDVKACRNLAQTLLQKRTSKTNCSDMSTAIAVTTTSTFMETPRSAATTITSMSTESMSTSAFCAGTTTTTGITAPSASTRSLSPSSPFKVHSSSTPSKLYSSVAMEYRNCLSFEDDEANKENEDSGILHISDPRMDEHLSPMASNPSSKSSSAKSSPDSGASSAKSGENGSDIDRILGQTRLSPLNKQT